MRYRGVIGVIALVTGAVLLTVLLGACTGGPGAPGPPGEPGPSLNWADVIEDAHLADSVYAIGMRAPIAALCLALLEECPEPDSADIPDAPGDLFFLVGTGFVAHYPNTIWTNAHVAQALRAFLAMAAEENVPDAPVPIAVRAGTAVGAAGTHRLNMDTLRLHPEYDEESFSSPDLAVFQVDGLPMGDVPSFLPRGFATGLRVGQPVATLGFPGELTQPFEAVPIATFKQGTISALRPYLPEPEVTPQNSKVVQFNLGQTGGTSGSPVFDHEGFIVAVSFGGIEAHVVDLEGFPVRIPIGALDLGIRVDEVWPLIDLIEAATEPPPAGARAYPYPTYHPYPDAWTGGTASDRARRP